MAHIILFEHINCRGAHKHVFGAENNLASGDDNWFNDKTSSFVILEGRWVFYRDINYAGPASTVLGPGKYNWSETFGIPNDSLSSLRSV